VFALVLWMRSRFNTQADFGTIMVPTVIQGIAMAFFFIPLMTITISGMPPERIPSASGLTNFVRITAGAIGTSVCTTLWENRAAFHHARLVENLTNANPNMVGTLSGLSGMGLSQDQSLAMVNQLVNQQAFMLAANDIFWGSAVLFLFLIPLVWLTHPQRGGGGADAAAGAH
jgi:DHA2 family multidrug resistance protein